jgi:methanogenic corrinoid protein MtbC1
MATAALREDHWQVHHLGVHIPVEQVSAIAQEEQATLVVLSAIYGANVAQAEVVARALSRPGRRVLLGRPGVPLRQLVLEARGPRSAR